MQSRPAPPDKRNTAYESIFGRPSASHHTAPRPGYASSVHGHPPSQPRTQGGYYYPHPPPSVTYGRPPPPPSSQYLGPMARHPQQYSMRPPSMVSAPYTAGVVAPMPPPEEPPDPHLEMLTRTGLTPAQAYRAQVSRTPYIPPSQTGDLAQQQSQSPGSAATMPIPQLRTIDVDEGQLGLDFSNIALNGRHSLPNAVESELPYASSTQLPSFSNAPLSHTADMRRSTASDYTLDGRNMDNRPYPLQLITALNSGAVDGSPTSSSFISEAPSLQVVKSRRSIESIQTLPSRPIATRRDRTNQDRSQSMSATSSQARALLDMSRSSLPPMPEPRSATASSAPFSVRLPSIYPAMISRVADAFQQSVTLNVRIKDGLAYNDAFDGREAVDKIAYIIKTTDRSLALLLGRALDAQKFFHDVTYDHRLRDSSNELYQFQARLATPFPSGELTTEDTLFPPHQPGSLVPDVQPSQDQSDLLQPDSSDLSTLDASADGHANSFDDVPVAKPQRKLGSMEEDPLPSGVFTLLTDCYSPTCSRDRLCYSIACPRRMEQQARLNMKPQPGLKRSISRESLGDLVEPGTLWIHSVPQEVVDSISDTEKKRQEAINEVMYTERDFVRDMEYLRDSWLRPLQTSDVIPEDRQQDFLEQVFWNLHDIIATNSKLRDALNKRQKQYAVVEQIGDVLLDFVGTFEPFIRYGAHQLYGKFEFEKEKSSNPAFAQFVEETERQPESRKLELNGYLTKPTTRLARYPLLLEAVLKHTPEDNPDKMTLPRVISIVREHLAKVNEESGKAENRFNLMQLDQQLVFRPGESVDLRLREEGRELVYKGALKRRNGFQSDSDDLLLCLFDHALLMVKQKTKHDQYKVFRRPIPLELLLVSTPDDMGNTLRQVNSRQRQTLMRKGSFTKTSSPTPPPVVVPKVDSGKGGLSMTFTHLGRKYYQITLWAPTIIARQKWLENLYKQQDIMRDRSLVFDTLTINEGFFVGRLRPHCAAPFDGGRRHAFGTDDGVYFSDAHDLHRPPVKVLAIPDVTQIDILEDYQLLILLSEHQVVTFPLDSLDSSDPAGSSRRGKKISQHTSFFKSGMCLGRTLVCIVKTSPISTTIKVMEPIDTNIRGRSKPTFKKLLQGGNDTLRAFKEFYIPVESSSVHYLRTKLCVGCVKGFEIVDLDTLETQAMLDPSDMSLDFIRRRDTSVRPMAIYRVDHDFLLCYDGKFSVVPATAPPSEDNSLDFAFFVNKNGWRSRKDFMVHWEGNPKAFALHYPYVLAFEPTFVEVRHVETGLLAQIVQGHNLRCLFADTPSATAHSLSPVHPHQSPVYGVPRQLYGNPLPPPPFDDRQSFYSNTGHYNPYNPIPPQHHQSRAAMHQRDHIVLASDERVLLLKLSSGNA